MKKNIDLGAYVVQILKNVNYENKN